MSTFRRTGHTLLNAFIAAVGRLDKSLSPSDTITKLRKHQWTLGDCIWILHFVLASFWLIIMTVPPFPYKLAIPFLYAVGVLIPLTSQFLIPATPVLSYLLAFYSNRFIPSEYRPTVSVYLLPTLESVLYGANISDILTRFTHPFLDIIAWLPYGVGHYAIPFVVAAFLWLFRVKESLHLWARVLGYMNLIGVITQILFPCAAPWYELIYGLTPAEYTVKGSPGGLIRIDALFHSHGYTTTFGNSPLVFGAFPSLHSGAATLEALFVSHFFPQTTKYVWSYAFVLYWATMYMTHHYLIDVVGGACLATACFYLFMPDELKNQAAATAPPGTNLAHLAYAPLGSGAPNGNGTLPAYRMGTQRSKYEIYDLESPRDRQRGGNGRGTGGGAGGRGFMADAEADFELGEDDDVDREGEGRSSEEEDITYRSPAPGATPMMSSFGKNGNSNLPEVVAGGAKGHRHTASIARLIRGPDARGDERVGTEEAWGSPIRAGFVFPGQSAGGRGVGKGRDGESGPRSKQSSLSPNRDS